MHGERRFCCCYWCWCLKDIFHRGLAADFGCVWRLCCKAQVLNVAYFRGRCAGRSFNPPPRTKDTGKEASPEAPAVRASTLSANTNGEQWMHGPIRRATARADLDGQITLERVSKLRGKTS
ncbi:hypothetical protein VFPFJ_03650 [Purpureocillium lilacinum]|uniref:Uncharacterized protein n=1 Tax=Purpureocillium lilacinum TaxID=33203 RepID=A0A179HR45_PURLI|nr:hypothetical protein VFPFJ_03650 [Purpureocillium lilacinum]OAQ91910.1 hypothetical protein VFPFJ_03650 [Purpureocillium lilacinum]